MKPLAIDLYCGLGGWTDGLLAEGYEVIGYTLSEQKRLRDWIANNPERSIWPILVERGLTKQDCFAILGKAGIELPTMYKLGYRNNNCIGCVKGQAGYWNKIRVDFPLVFARMAKVERELNVAINKSYAGDGKRKRIFLDELAPDAGRYEAEPSISCGLFCETAATEGSKTDER